LQGQLKAGEKKMEAAEEHYAETEKGEKHA
jgi:hypothetical protein